MNFVKTEFPGRPVDERMDCVVRAFSIAAELDYLEVHKVLSECGRKYRRRTSFEVSDRAAEKLRLKSIEIKETITLRKMLTQLESVAACAIRVKGHMVPVILGSEADFKAIGRGRQHVQKVFISEKYYFGDL